MKEESKDLQQMFMDLSVKYARPFILSQDCSQEIAAIIKKGISKIEEVSDDEDERISKAQKELFLFIEEMKKNASGKVLMQEDIERAKEKFCPTWPCK